MRLAGNAGGSQKEAREPGGNQKEAREAAQEAGREQFRR